MVLMRIYQLMSQGWVVTKCNSTKRWYRSWKEMWEITLGLSNSLSFTLSHLRASMKILSRTNSNNIKTLSRLWRKTRRSLRTISNKRRIRTMHYKMLSQVPISKSDLWMKSTRSSPMRNASRWSVSTREIFNLSNLNCKLWRKSSS